MAKTRRQKKLRGGDVKDGEYLYTISIANVSELTPFGDSIVYKHLDKAKESIQAMADQLLDQNPRTRISLYRNPEFASATYSGVGRVDKMKHSALWFPDAYSSWKDIYIYRWKLNAEVPESMKPSQRIAIGQLADKEELPPKVEQNIAAMTGVKGL